VPSPGIFTITVSEMIQGTGNRLDFNPYDIIAGDNISVNIFVNAGDGQLPPA